MTFHGLAEYLFIAHKASKISERHENIRYSKKKKNHVYYLWPAKVAFGF